MTTIIVVLKSVVESITIVAAAGTIIPATTKAAVATMTLAMRLGFFSEATCAIGSSRDTRRLANGQRAERQIRVAEQGHVPRKRRTTAFATAR